jgi:UDP-N-acetylglucosamine--N-acetylmuramyl-(pentapeptide) pyrophosphoryl-undecaprenol N-acetylglucosamine transferase
MSRKMNEKCFYFAGGGTGGHIYPAIAVAEKILKIEPAARVHFFCSNRELDRKILSKTGFEFTQLPAEGFSIHPKKLVRFVRTFFQSERIAGEKIAQSRNVVIIGVGGFAAAPVCRWAYKRKLPVVLINVDIVPGKANRLIARWAERIFVQFEETKEYLKKQKSKIEVVGCPLRSGFDRPDAKRAIEKLGLDKNKKILLITGASSGSQNINRTVYSLIGVLDKFADKWQVVHLTGANNLREVRTGYSGAKITCKVMDYYDDMADLMSAADLVIGRSGAVSVAEYAASGVASICIPYPYHKDKHQYLNAGKLVEAGAGIIVDDVPDQQDRREWLAEELELLLSDEGKLAEMKENSRRIAKKDAAERIAEELTGVLGGKN